MKFTAIFSAAAALVAVTNAATPVTETGAVAPATQTDAAAPATGTDTVSCDVTALSSLLTSKTTTTCASDSGYQVTSLVAPSDAQKTIICTSPACQSIMGELQEIAPKECSVGKFRLYADLLNPLNTFCEDNGLSSGGMSSDPTDDNPTQKNTTTTEDTDEEGPTSRPPSSDDDTTQETTPSAETPSSATESSGVSMATASVGAVVVAVAITFF